MKHVYLKLKRRGLYRLILVCCSWSSHLAAQLSSLPLRPRHRLPHSPGSGNRRNKTKYVTQDNVDKVIQII